MEKTYHLAKVPVFPVANGCPVQRDGVAKEQRVKIWKARAPPKKGVNHPPLNEDVETIEKLTNDTGTGICAVHPPEMRKGRGGEKGRKREKGGEEKKGENEKREGKREGETHLSFLDSSHLAAASPPACPTFNLFSFLAYSSLSTAFTRSSMWPSSKPFQIRRGAVKQAAWIERGYFRFPRRISGPGGGRRMHTTGST